MQVTKKNVSDTKVQLVLEADADQLKAAKKETLEHLAIFEKLVAEYGASNATLLENR